MRGADLSIAGFVGLAALASVAACVREGTAVVAPVEVTIDKGDGGPAMPLVIAAPSLAGDRDRCTAVLRPAAIKTNPGCTLDERLSHGSGTLLYPCVGDGAVEAIFGDHRFFGKITESAVALALATELEWEDGCHWETKQAIVGDFKRERERDGSSRKRAKLAWSYSEAPVSGANCYGSCTATADVQVAPGE